MTNWGKDSKPKRFETLPPTENSVFDQAIKITLQHEGLWSNDPDDPGGATKNGISLRLAKELGDLDGDGELDLDLNKDGLIDERDMRRIKAEDAIRIYRLRFWDPYPYEALAPAIAMKVFDFGVNMGPKQAHILLQRALRAVTKEAVSEDGIIGQQTISLSNKSYTPALLAALRSEAAGFYRQLAARRPASRKYLKGWLNRAYS